MTTAGDWTGGVGDVWAAEWQRTDRSFADLARHLDAAILAAAPVSPFDALDIGCGAGATALALAAARPDAKVTGVDLSPTLVAAAMARGRGGRTAAFSSATSSRRPETFAPISSCRAMA